MQIRAATGRGAVAARNIYHLALYQATIRPLALVSCVQRRRSTLSNTSTRIARRP